MMVTTLFPKQHSTVHDKDLAKQRTGQGKTISLFHVNMWIIGGVLIYPCTR